MTPWLKVWSAASSSLAGKEGLGWNFPGELRNVNHIHNICIYIYTHTHIYIYKQIYSFICVYIYTLRYIYIYIQHPEYYCLKFKQLRGCVYSSIILHTDPQVCPRPELNSVITREFCTTSNNGKDFMFNYVARVLISSCCFYISNNQNIWYSISNNSRT